jgi:hypothetical protein
LYLTPIRQIEFIHSSLLIMTLVDSYPASEAQFKIDHFHEYDLNTDELFEVREIFTLPTPSHIPITVTPMTRMGKLKSALSKVTRKKSLKASSLQVLPHLNSAGISRHATFPRMTTERERHVQALHDEMYGIGAYAPSKAVEVVDDEEPKVWVPPRLSKDQPPKERNKDVKAEEEERGRIGSNEQKERDRLVKTELERNATSLKTESGQAASDTTSKSGCNPIYISNSLASASSQPGQTRLYSHDATRVGENMTDERLRKPLAPTPSARILTNKGVRELLGDKIADSIATEMTLRLGPPSSLPSRPIKPREENGEVLKIREKVVVQTYALWASIFLFEKLVLAIRLSLPSFKPSYRGMITFQFEVFSLQKL